MYSFSNRRTAGLDLRYWYPSHPPFFHGTVYKHGGSLKLSHANRHWQYAYINTPFLWTKISQSQALGCSKALIGNPLTSSHQAVAISSQD